MSFGLNVNNANGNNIFNSEDTPYSFTTVRKRFSYSKDSGGTYQNAYCDFSGSEEAMVAMEWPTVSGNPSASQWNAHGVYLQISSLGGGNFRAYQMWANQRARFDNTSGNFYLYVIDKVKVIPPAGSYGMVAYDSSGKETFSTSMKLVNVASAGTINVSGNTIIGGNSDNQLLFMHGYYSYRRNGSLVGPWHDDVYIYPAFGVNSSKQFRASRIRMTVINSHPVGRQYRYESSQMPYMIIDKP